MVTCVNLRRAEKRRKDAYVADIGFVEHPVRVGVRLSGLAKLRDGHWSQRFLCF